LAAAGAAADALAGAGAVAGFSLEAGVAFGDS